MTKFYNALGLFILFTLFVSCGHDDKGNFTLKGSIKGLKKGTVYLQKDSDTSIVNLDSLQIIGEKEFILETNLEEPMLLYLKLFKNDGEEHFIPFFADKGVTEIKTTLDNFNFDVEINGSEQQKLLDSYLDIMEEFKNQNLDLIEASLLAQKDGDSIAFDSITKLSERLIKRKYSYTIQYAMNNSDSEIAPYLALYEVPSANPIYIDSIYNKLTDNIKLSFYGKKLKKFIEARNIE
ncbi:DUF4369 domain-containing protein [Winogradskyella alexanderae]|uniref:DUF4369 domain-containing protein n=1 Tax=Winogradskyella alexanderae TaxID=2877123 RepID=A0ABS7XPZ5_9FLAO|nr:DUF4369 domain-containing protein [Winogradskyella alexanderae]MCA0132076.1 DUF4369 domain-containing protein [Winogradskyella alexanderae]